MGRNSVSGWLLISLALALLVLPLRWVIAAAFAAVFHEYCHYLAVRGCGGRILGFRAGHSGAVMEVRGLSLRQELFCTLVGPAGSLALLFLAKWFPRLAICAGFQGLYNLLPVYPLDGGRALRCCAELLLPVDVAQKLCEVLEWICLIGVLILGAYGSFGLHLGLLPLLGAVCLTMRIFQGKRPCKLGLNSVQ